VRFLANLHKIDRRIVYLLLAAVVALPLVSDIVRLPLITKHVRPVYDAIESIPTNNRGVRKIAIISIVWSAGTFAENRPQTEVLARHFFRRGIPFAILPWDQQGTTLAFNAVERVAKEMGKKYGVDWMSFGFQPFSAQIIQGLGTNLPRTLKRDKFGTPLSQIPMMKGIENAQNLCMVAEVTPSGTVPTWISFIGQPYRVPIAYAPTSVMLAEGYNLVDAKQVVGMIPGLVGAAEYDKLLGHSGFALRGANALSTSHILIIVLIILGNVGYLMSRRQQRQS